MALPDHQSFAFDTPQRVSTAQFMGIIAEVDQYDYLTVGPASEHSSALRKMIEFGSNCLMVAGIGPVDESAELQASSAQTETLFA